MLLKNGKSADKPLLPFPKKTSKILVAGSHADNIGNQCGGWTIVWQGQSGNITIGNLQQLLIIFLFQLALNNFVRDELMMILPRRVHQSDEIFTSMNRCLIV